MSYQRFIHSSVTNLTITQVLNREPSVLLGVTPGAESLLRQLHIHTVFDLGTSTIFDNAARLMWSGEELDSEFRRFGRAPASFVDSDILRQTPITELPYHNIENLTGIGPSTGPALMNELALERIRDLALWPPYLAAKAIVLEAYNPDADLEIDPEAPAELIPKSGSFGTERFLYSSVVMFPGDHDNEDPQLINNQQFDITISPEVKFDKMRYGARLTYSHNWIPKNVAKGQLLHSLPLAPGESTSVAVVEWSNKIAAATRQTVSESERISSVNDRSRAIGQITGAVASEFQSGSSVSASESASGSAWITGGLPLSVGFASASANETVATTHTVSSGERSVDSFLRQNIADSTHQVSSAVRGQRAAVVTEVSQKESEYLSTRSVTNYNHMHALTIQYYEVVQIYETEVRLHDYERCIFIPMEPLDFRDERNIFRYAGRLRAAALDEITRDALDDLMDTDQHNTLTFEIDRVPASLFNLLPAGGGPITQMLRQMLRGQLDAWGSSVRAGYRVLEQKSLLDQPDQNLPPHHVGLPFRLMLRSIRFSPSASGRSAIKAVEIVREDGTVITINTSEDFGAGPWNIHDEFPGQDAISFGAIREIKVIPNPAFQPGQPGPMQIPDLNEWRVPFELAVAIGNDIEWLDCSFIHDPTPGAYNVPILRVTTPQGIVQAADLLMEHQLYYSQQVWLRENPQTLIMQFAPFALDVGGERINLVDHIAPVPLTVVGNYVVYRFTYEKDAEWQKWVNRNIDLGKVDADEVPVPTGGVFAEAVLGRFNSAEKIDLTRFFNWMDSPPPAPPAIAALRAGQREGGTAPAQGSIDRTLVNIQTPIALPDANGLGAALTALTTAELFRNMGGAAATGAAGVGAVEASSANSINALNAAGETFTGLLKTMAGMFSTMTSEQGLKTLSEIGSLMNEKIKNESHASVSSAGTTTALPSPARSAEVIDELLENTFVGGSTDGATGGNGGSTTTPGTATTAIDTAPEISAPGIAPAPSGITTLTEGAERPSLALISAYLSQFENDERVPQAANDLFAYGGVQTAGLKLRHAILEGHLGGAVPLQRGQLWDLAQLFADLPGVASLACHNVLRSFARGAIGTTYEKMALPWERTGCGGLPALQPWVQYRAGVPGASGLNDYKYTFVQGTTPDEQFLRPADADLPKCARIGGKRPTGFYQLFRASDLGLDDPGDWYHFFLTHTITTLFAQNQIADDEDEWLGIMFNGIQATNESKFYTLAIFGALTAMRAMLRDFHQQTDPPNHPSDIDHVYEGWLWANSLGMLEGIGYGADPGEEKAQADVNRESKVHYEGAFAGLDHTIGVTNIIPGGVPNWKWVVPKAGQFVTRIRDFMNTAKRLFDESSFIELMEFTADFADRLMADMDISRHVEQVWDFTGAVVSGPPAPTTSLVRGQHVPASSEKAASGAIIAPIVPGTPGHDALVVSNNAKIIHKGGDATAHPMTAELSARLDVLADLVAAEWPDFRLRITSAWRERPSGDEGKSLHYEGRACDLNVIEDDSAIIAAGTHDSTRLGRMAQLAVEAGFSWVFYEDASHVHASVPRI